jgi:ribonucleoside-diphosphate reductase alpha chain
MTGPQTEAAERLHAMKYRQPGEDFREAVNRVAFGLKDDDAHYKALRPILLDQRFLPGGRIQLSIGSQYATTAYNCFVSGTIADSMVTGQGNIMQRQTEAVATLRLGGGIGFDFSTLRPHGDPINELGTVTEGPLSFMHAFNAYSDCIAGAGMRRGAMMAVLRVDHPDIERFVRAKQNEHALRRFNISVAVTDEFMDAVAGDKPFTLRFGSQKRREVSAVELWEKIMRSTHDWAEPGVIFVDRINEMNNLWYCETIAACNPCSEQSLPPFGACLLGSFNLVKYLEKVADDAWEFDWDQLRADIPVIVRAMDNVVDRARYPLAQQKAEAISKRRMGLGVAGLANAAEALGHAYGSADFLSFEAEVLACLRDESYRASAQLAAEKCAFPFYDDEKYLAGRFIKTLPDDVRAAIAKHGIRNSHLTSIAPTGTISLCADNVSGGIEPVFSYKIERPIVTPDGVMMETVEDYGAKFLGVRGKLATDVTADEHIDVLCTGQAFVDSAISKTINMDEKKMGFDEFKSIYRKVFDRGGKGCATFNVNGKRGALLASEEGGACYIDPATGRKECA